MDVGDFDFEQVENMLKVFKFSFIKIYQPFKNFRKIQ